MFWQLALLFFVCCQLASAQDKLSLLAFIPFTGSEPSDGRLCQASMEIAVDEVNHNPHFLAGYQVDVTYADEAVLGSLSPANLMNFLFRFEQPGYDPGHEGYLAPAVVGNYYICQAISGIIRQYNMVEFATWCAGTLFTGDRKNFPNLYRRVVPQEVFIATQLYLAEFIGQWKEVGIVFFQDNISEFLVAKLLYEAFESNGISVVWFASIISFENSNIIDSLTSSRARIVYLGFYESPRMLAFICLAHLAGLRGPRYQFVAYGNTYTDPYSNKIDLPNGCTPRMVLEMYESVLFIGNFEGLAEGSVINKNTSLGYDIVEFEARLDRKTFSTRTADYARRYICHDAMVHALVTLDRADRHLQKRYNLTLRDFGRHSATVMAVVNETAAFEPYEGLQHRLMYSVDRLEVDRRFQGIAQYVEVDTSLEVAWLLWHFGNSSKTVLNVSTHYQTTELKRIRWNTKNGSPVRDLSALVHLQQQVSSAAFWAVLVVCTASTLLIVTLTVYVSIALPGNQAISNAKFTNVSLCIGASLLNLASIFFVVSPLTTAVCIAQNVLATLGASVLLAALYSKLVLIGKFFKVHREATQEPRRIVTTLNQFSSRRTVWVHSPRLAPRRMPVDVLTSQQKLAIVANVKAERLPLYWRIGTFLGVVTILLIVWQAAHEPTRAFETVSEPQFSDPLDAYYDISTVDCRSASGFYWQLAFAVLSVMPLLFSLFIMHDLRHAAIHQVFKEEVNYLRGAFINSAAIYACLVISVHVVSLAKTRAVLWAGGLLVFGVSSAIMAFRPLLKIRKNRLSPEGPVIVGVEPPSENLVFASQMRRSTGGHDDTDILQAAIFSSTGSGDRHKLHAPAKGFYSVSAK